MRIGTRGLVLLDVVAIVAVLLVGVSPAGGQSTTQSHTFRDVPDDHLFADDIGWIAGEGITRGCNPPANDEFCPDEPVTRGQMAAFLTRGLELQAWTDPGFQDTEGTTFEADIAALGSWGITRGCNEDRTMFCPDRQITRGQMAAFLRRALVLENEAADPFTDDDGHPFEGDINRIRAAGITRGCNPPDNDQFCPDAPVTRGQMAAFLTRALADPECRDSYNPRCGPFEWDYDPATFPNAPLEYSWEPDPVVATTGEPEAVTLTLQDPDDGWPANCGLLEAPGAEVLLDGHPHDSQLPCAVPACIPDRRHGPWEPPAPPEADPEVLQLELTYTESGQYEVTVETRPHSFCSSFTGYLSPTTFTIPVTVE